MDIRTIHADGRVVAGGPPQALRFPVTFDSARQGAFAQGVVDFRSAGLVLDVLAGQVRLERKGFLPVRYRVPHLVTLLLEPGTLTRIFLETGPSFAVGISPSGRVNMARDGKSKLVMAPEKSPPGASEEVIQTLRWEYEGHVDEASQTMADVLVRASAGLPALQKQPMAPTTAASLDCCVRFLEMLPNVRPRLHLLTRVSQPWANVVAAWDELEACLLQDRPSGDGT